MSSLVISALLASVGSILFQFPLSGYEGSKKLKKKERKGKKEKAITRSRRFLLCFSKKREQERKKERTEERNHEESPPFKIFRTNRVSERNHGLLVWIARHRFAHVVRVLAALVVLEHTPIFHIAQLVVHPQRVRVALAHKQIHKVPAVPLCHCLQLSHQLRRQSQSPRLRCHRHRRHVSVPQFLLSLNFADNCVCVCVCRCCVNLMCSLCLFRHQMANCIPWHVQWKRSLRWCRIRASG